MKCRRTIENKINTKMRKSIPKTTDVSIQVKMLKFLFVLLLNSFLKLIKADINMLRQYS